MRTERWFKDLNENAATGSSLKRTTLRLNGFCFMTSMAISACADMTFAHAASISEDSARSHAQPRIQAKLPPRKVRLFNIPAQPLSAALEAYGVVTGNQLIYDSRLIQRRRSNPVIGLFSPETALRMLLDGTDLTIRYTGPRDITLVSIERIRIGDRQSAAEVTGAAGELTLDTLYVDVAPGVADRPDFTAYGRAVRLEVKRALANTPNTANRIYHIQFDVEVDRQGRIERANLLRSSGSGDVDRLVRHVIEDVRLNQPPPSDMPQPIRITVVAI